MSRTIPEIPENANDGCVGPQSEAAGKSRACQGCPNQKSCASGANRVHDPSLGLVEDRMSCVRNRILVLSGKGGVGKSTVSCQMAFELASRGFQVGLLDVDICGPSVPRMLGLIGQEVHQSASGWSPVYLNPHLGVMSVGFMLPSTSEAIIWRGPRKNGLIKQFLTDVDWGELDYLIIDSMCICTDDDVVIAPPGTSDEHLSLVQYLASSSSSSSRLNAVLVTTPQEVAVQHVRKMKDFCQKTNMNILGLVENMRFTNTSLQALRFIDPATNQDKSKEVLDQISRAVPRLSSLMVQVDLYPPNPNSVDGDIDVRHLGSISFNLGNMRACDDGDLSHADLNEMKLVVNEILQQL